MPVNAPSTLEQPQTLNTASNPSHGTATKLRYRADIDGLRGIAVLLVVFNHLHTRFTGGYIGVDVFFVISGYLISSVIISELLSQRFSLLGFYERRIRRILPALLVTLVGTILLSCRYFVPSEAVPFGWSTLAAQFSVSNFYFLKGDGYFGVSASFKPLLHTWSLSVEEQFYIFFPLFIILVLRWRAKWLKTSVWTAAILSLVLAEAAVPHSASYAFYLAPLRAWELLLGTILSQHYLPAIRSRLLRNTASVTGLALVLIPALLYHSDTPFPGVAAIPPCLGAALIIAAGEAGSSSIGQVLSSRPLAFVGLISYSLYLWHWPIMVFQRTSHMLLDAPLNSKRVKLAILVVSGAMACLSWKFVETPFRKGRYRPDRNHLFWISGAGFATVALLAVSLIASGGFPSRFSGQALAVSRYTTYDPAIPYRMNQCFLDTSSSFNQFTPDTCLRTDPTRRQFLLLGDSHAAQLYSGLSSVFPELNISQATVASCRPFKRPQTGSKTTCSRMLSYIYDDYLPKHPVDTVLLGGRWEDTELPDLERTVTWIQQHGMKVVVFGPNIEYDLALPRILAFSLQNHTPADLPKHRLQLEGLDEQWKLFAHTQPGLRYISLYDDLCTRSPARTMTVAAHSTVDCPTMIAAGVPLLFDTDHLTPEASTLLARIIKERGQLP